MDEQTVRDAIYALIERNDKRIKEVRKENMDIVPGKQRILNEMLIEEFHVANYVLLELEHNLRLCDCPAEAYQHIVES
jgi:hypothetical protein